LTNVSKYSLLDITSIINGWTAAVRQKLFVSRDLMLISLS